MQIPDMQDLHSVSHQKKTRFSGCMRCDQANAVLSIQAINTMHQSFFIVQLCLL